MIRAVAKGFDKVWICKHEFNRFVQSTYFT